MFVDFSNAWPPPGPWEPDKSRARLTKRQERLVAWIIGVNLLLLLVAPLGGSTVVDAVVALLRY